MDRRRFLSLCGQVSLVALTPAPLLASPRPSPAPVAARRILSLVNTHTGERLTTVYRENGQLLPDALAAIDRILRDHRTGEVKAIDPRLLDLLCRVAERLDAREAFHVVSGYRSPATNEQLRRNGRGVAKGSYHLRGQAIDVRLPGRSTRELRQVALGEKFGGVGHYPGPGFVHLDTGPFRTW